jgi:putative hydrolase of the HAD superfamily
MIEGVTFDWWNTLGVASADQDRRLRSLRIERLRTALPPPPEAGHEVRDEVLLAAYDRQTELLTEAWARDVDPSPPEQIATFLRLAGLDGVRPSLADAASEAFGGALLETPPALFPHVAETLEWLKREGYAVGLVSNTGRTWGRYLRRVQDRLGIGRYFDARIFSDEVGVRKPQPRIFEAALSELGLPPASVVHIGDDVTADVAGAKAFGMRAIWFDTGRWPDARTDRADAVIGDHADLPALLQRWRR